MANEVSITLKTVLANGNLNDRWDNGTISLTQTTKGLHAAVESVGTSEEDMSYGVLSTPGLIMMRNLDATNYITYGPKSGGSMVLMGKLAPGQQALFYLGASVQLRWIANTSACLVSYKVYEA